MRPFRSGDTLRHYSVGVIPGEESEVHLKVQLLREAEAKRIAIELVRKSEHIDVAVAWAGKNQVVDALLKHRAQLRHVVIGTHMYQTDPWVLRQLIPQSAARCMPPNGRLFHPKIYLFHLTDGVAALVGSHNLTAGAFDGGNIEASILVRGKSADKALVELAKFVKSAWKRAQPIDEEFLFAYERQYEINREKRGALDHFYRLKKPQPGSSKQSPLNLPWGEFVRRVKADKHHSFEKRLLVLEGGARFFVKRRSFASMKRDERRAIAGTYGEKEEVIDELPWAWFGTMFGHGDFKNLVNDSPEGLSSALGHIPLDGDISEADYRAFANDFTLAFQGKTHKGGAATASRLLTMKRPDIFVSVNAANRQGLCAAFGVAHSTLHVDNYWERIVVPTQMSPWWQQARPRGAMNGRIWDNRAALLDCIYYDPAAKKAL